MPITTSPGNEAGPARIATAATFCSGAMNIWLRKTVVKPSLPRTVTPRAANAGSDTVSQPSPARARL